MSKAWKYLGSSVTRRGGLAVAGACMFFLGGSAKADTTLFTTQEDFTGWSGSQLTLAPSSTDLDANPTNGVGNTTSAGSAGTPGSLAVTWVSGSYDNNEFSPGEQGNAAFRTAIGLPATGASSGTVTGTIKMDYTKPTTGVGTYFQLGMLVNCDNNFGQFFGNETADGGGVFTATIPFTINTSNLTYFQLGLIYNSTYTPSAPFYVDNIRIQDNNNPPPTPGNGSWKVPGSGTWSGTSSAEWDPNVPDAVDNIATFGTYGGTINVPTTVNVKGSITAGTINFDNTAGYTLAGTSTMTLQASGSGSVGINVFSGNHTITLPMQQGTYTTQAGQSPTYNIAANSSLTMTNLHTFNVGILKTGAGTLTVNSIHNATVSIQGGTMKMLPDGTSNGTSNPYSLSIGNGSELDLSNNSFVVPGGDAATFQGYIAAAYAGGSWTGTSSTSPLVGSSNAAAIAATASNSHKTAVGYAAAFTLTSSWIGGVNPGGSNLLLSYTLAGDSDLNGSVDMTDFNALAMNFGQGGKLWTDGDFNYDGVVNALDLNAIATNFGAPLSAPVALGALVPEPSALSILLLAGMFSRRRREMSRGK
jgi:hypothetical protein